MTKLHLANEIFNTVLLNEDIGTSRKEIVEMIIGLLSVLEPKNKKCLNEWYSSKNNNGISINHLALELYNNINHNNNVNTSKSEIIDVIDNTLKFLEPKDKENFAQWGRQDQRSSIKNCWE